MFCTCELPQVLEYAVPYCNLPDCVTIVNFIFTLFMLASLTISIGCFSGAESSELRRFKLL